MLFWFLTYRLLGRIYNISVWSVLLAYSKWLLVQKDKELIKRVLIIFSVLVVPR